MSKSIKRLIFVFNAKSGFMDAFVDSAKKVLMIKGCSLCRITHGLTGPKEEWNSCQAELGVDVDFYHKDDMSMAVENVVAGEFPVILADDGEKLIKLITSETLDRCKGNVHDLKGKILYHAASKGLDLPRLKRFSA